MEIEKLFEYLLLDGWKCNRAKNFVTGFREEDQHHPQMSFVGWHREGKFDIIFIMYDNVSEPSRIPYPTSYEFEIKFDDWDKFLYHSNNYASTQYSKLTPSEMVVLLFELKHYPTYQLISNILDHPFMAIWTQDDGFLNSETYETLKEYENAWNPRR